MNRYVAVVFDNSGANTRIYYYRTKLDLQVGAKYKIINDLNYEYSNPVKIVDIVSAEYIDAIFSTSHTALRTIISAECIENVPVPDNQIKVVKFDKSKGVTAVRWKDGTVTKVRCANNDIFDKEKGLALCYMKKFAFNNRACFNESLKQYCHSEEDT